MEELINIYKLKTGALFQLAVAGPAMIKNLKKEKIKLSHDVADFISRRIKSNIRELEGCLIKLAAHSSLTSRPITLEMAKEILKDMISDDTARPVTPELIQKVVSEYFGLRQQDMKLKKRTKEIAIPRQIGMYLTKRLTELSLSDIGKHFGGKDHATVIYACKVIEERISKDQSFERLIKSLIDKIKP